MLKRAQVRTRSASRDPEATREAILTAATDEFAGFGLGGARVDRIAERAGINKRMLYYYFGKQGGPLPRGPGAGLRKASAARSRTSNLTQVEPTEAIRRLIAFTWNYYIENP